jgi:hypothetical protein
MQIILWRVRDGTCLSIELKGWNIINVVGKGKVKYQHRPDIDEY